MKIDHMGEAREFMFDLLAGAIRESDPEMWLEVIEDLDQDSAQWVIMAAQEMVAGMFASLCEHWSHDSEMTYEQILEHSLESLKAAIAT